MRIDRSFSKYHYNRDVPFVFPPNGGKNGAAWCFPERIPMPNPSLLLQCRHLLSKSVTERENSGVYSYAKRDNQ